MRCFLTILILSMASCAPGKFHDGESELGSYENSGDTSTRDVSSITKGSFTVSTEPRDPVPHRPYFIVIDVDYRGLSSVSPTDLAGFVKGTDRYRQDLHKPFGFKNGRSTRLPVPKYEYTAKGLRLRVHVPGAARRVQDTIQIYSKYLDEQQLIKIEF